jgi:hypothetical protein
MSSNLIINQLQAMGSEISVLPPSFIHTPGEILQVGYIRSDARVLYSAPPSGNGTTIDQLQISIAPKKANSDLLIRWMINGELHQDAVMLIHQNRQLVVLPGYEGYNNVQGNNRWSGITSSVYDVNESTTPENWFIQYSIPAMTTEPRTYAPAVRSSSSGSYTLALNRVLNNVGTDGQENMISTGVIMEIAK